MPQVTVFDRIVAEMLRDSEFRIAVKADPEGEIGKHRWTKKLDDAQRAAIIKIAAESPTTEMLDEALEGTGRTSAYYFTDW
jgi:hypothetical protein